MVNFDQLSELLALYGLTLFSQEADFNALPPHLVGKLLQALLTLWELWSQAAGVPERWLRALRCRIQFAENAVGF